MIYGKSYIPWKHLFFASRNCLRTPVSSLARFVIHARPSTDLKFPTATCCLRLAWQPAAGGFDPSVPSVQTLTHIRASKTIWLLLIYIYIYMYILRSICIMFLVRPWQWTLGPVPNIFDMLFFLEHKAPGTSMESGCQANDKHNHASTHERF